MTSSDHTITAPAELTLNCSADGKPRPTITWTRVSDSTVVYMPLTITGGRNEESYRCTADNGVGKPLTRLSTSIFCVGKSNNNSCYCIYRERGARCIDQTRGTAADRS